MLADAPDLLSLAFRIAGFILLLNASGVPIFNVALSRVLSPESLRATARLGGRMAIAALVFVVGQYLLEAGRMAGDLSGVLDPSLQAMVLQSSTGVAFGLRVAGLVLIGAGLMSTGAALRWRGRAVALSGAALSILSFTAVGHTSVSPYRPAAAALLVLHLLIVSFWMGALWPLYQAPSSRLIDAFSRTAAWIVPVILLA